MPPLVLVPGLMCNGAVWQPLFAHWPASLACHVVDPGATGNLTAMAQRLLEEAPARFALAGHSMGGRVAMEVVRLAPERVSHLALLDTGHLPLAAGDAGAQEVAQRMALLRIAREQGVRAMATQWVQGMVHPDRLGDAPLIESILQMFEQRSAETFAAQLQALIERPDASSVLRSLQMPTLIACGRQDAWSTLAQHEAMQRLAPKAALHVIEDCGHMAMMERPRDVAAMMSDWLTAPA